MYTQETKDRSFNLVSPYVNFFILPANSGKILRVVSVRVHACVFVCVCLRANVYAYYLCRSVFRNVLKWKFAS